VLRSFVAGPIIGPDSAIDAPPILRPRQKVALHPVLSPADIVFRLATLAALNLLLFWYPVYYFTTYESGPDGREGLILIHLFWLCPASWVCGPYWYFQAWRRCHVLRSPIIFRAVCTILLMIVMSTTVYLAYRIHLTSAR